MSPPSASILPYTGPEPGAYSSCGATGCGRGMRRSCATPRSFQWVRQRFDFLGYRIVRTKRKCKLPAIMIRSRLNPKGLIAYPTDQSIRSFRDRVRALTRRCSPLKTEQLVKELNPTLREWGEYYKRANIRTLFHKLDGWIVRRIWSHRFRRWRIAGWKQLPAAKLYGEFGLVNLISLIPSLRYRPRPRASSSKLYAGNRHVQFERRTEASASARLLRPDNRIRRARVWLGGRF
ncbi:MAG: prophage lambdaSa1 transcriptase/maturase family protein [Candidatus Sulfotelmatobacter sp.]|nr:prophage lambdaSa1 transcriptase/maturase family protein [Candidatus Sulfotelmatobacter sp.]